MLRSANWHSTGHKLGEGAFGTVVRGIDGMGKDCAIKSVPMTPQHDMDQSTVREMCALYTISHHNVLPIRACRTDSMGTEMKLPLCDGSLHDYMRARGALAVPALRDLTQQILRGVRACHRVSIAHRDLKPENILVSQRADGTVRLYIADFGLSRNLQMATAGELTPLVVTLWYRAPEVLLGSGYSEKIDLWSVGVIMWEMAQGGLTPFRGDSELEQLRLIAACMGLPSGAGGLAASEPVVVDWHALLPASLGAQGIDLVRGLLALDPRVRLSAETACKHSFAKRSGPSMRSRP